MALSNVAAWNDEKVTSACGSACGAADEPKEAPAACGAADEPKETPAACRSACGASDK